MADTNTTIKIADGSQIQFKHGTQSKLDEIRSAKTGTSGTFYLTNDTHRLYVGLSDSSIVPVNEGITTYAAVGNLPTANAMNAGQFAYITESSILAVSNGQVWVQINANTDTLYTYSGLVEDDNAGTVTITTKLADKENANNFTKYSFSLTGANGIKIMETTDDGGITVYGTKLGYTVADNVARIQLVDKDGTQDSAVAIKAGNNVSITEDSGAINISATDTKLDGSLSHGSSEATGFKIFAKDTSGASSGGTIDPVITYGENGSASVHFENGTATLDVYTREEVDNLKAAFDAMEYKGVTSGLPTGTDVQNGWTYKASSSFDIPAANSATGVAITVYAGDLIIAEEAEGETTIKWGYVPSGNEDTTYKIALLTQGIQLQQYPTGSSTGTPIGSIEVLSGTNITVSPSSSSTDKTMKLTVNHDAANRSDAATTTESINTAAAGTAYQVKNGAITVIDASQGTNGIDTDDQGHIKKVYTKTVTIYDTNARLDSMGVSVIADDAKTTATVALTPKLITSKNETITKTGNVYFKSLNSNLQMTASGTNVQMDFVWGEF